MFVRLGAQDTALLNAWEDSSCVHQGYQIVGFGSGIRLFPFIGLRPQIGANVQIATVEYSSLIEHEGALASDQESSPMQLYAGATSKRGIMHGHQE